MGIETMILGAVVSAAGTMMGAMAQKNQAEYQAQVARNNAQIAERNALYAEQQGVKREQEEIWKGRSAVGEQVAGFAASGLTVGAGSSDDVLTGTRRMIGASTGNVRDATAREAYGYRVQSMNFEAEAGLADHRAGMAIPMGVMGTASSLLGAATKIGPAFGDMLKSGSGGPTGAALVY